MPDIIRKELTGVACDKLGADTRKYYWYVEDEHPISEANCRFWQKEQGYDPESYGCYKITIRHRKRGGWQATWVCAFESEKSKRHAALNAALKLHRGERKHVKLGSGHRGAVVYIDHKKRAINFKKKKHNSKKKKQLNRIKDYSLISFSMFSS